MNRSKLNISALSLCAILLTACGTANFNPPAQDDVTNQCPPVKEYSQEFMDKVAREIEALPGDSVLVEVLSDYAVVRAQLRACR